MKIKLPNIIYFGSIILLVVLAYFTFFNSKDESPIINSSPIQDFGYYGDLWYPDGDYLTPVVPSWGIRAGLVSVSEALTVDGTASISGIASISDIVIPEIYNNITDPSGFLDRNASLSWDDSTRTFTITGNHDIYINGVRSTKGTATKQIADATGIHLIYYDSDGVLQEVTADPSFENPFVATVYWNTTTDKGLMGEERHGIKMDVDTHEWMHFIVGTQYKSGLTGTFDSSSLSITSGEIKDEDITHSIGTETTANVLYKNGSADFEWDEGQALYFKEVGGTLQYNNGNALANVPLSNYVAYWIYATNDASNPIVSLMGQRVDTTLAGARSNNTLESLALGTLPFREMKILYRVLVRNQGGASTYIETQDLRSISNIPAGTFVASSHSPLSDLNWANAGHTFDVDLDVGAFGLIASGGSSIGDLDVYGTTSISDNLFTYGNNLFQPVSDSFSAFRIASSGYTAGDDFGPLFNVNTDDQRVSVGKIATDSPSSIFQIFSGDTNRVALFESNNGRAAIQLQDDDTSGFVSVDDTFTTIGPTVGLTSTSLNINSTGQVGIRTTSVSHGLNIDDTASISGAFSIDQYMDYIGIATPSTPLSGTGRVYFDSNSNQLNLYDGIDWQNLASSGGAGTLDGSGTANFHAKWSDSDTLTDSILWDDGTDAYSSGSFTIDGAVSVSGNFDSTGYQNFFQPTSDSFSAIRVASSGYVEGDDYKAVFYVDTINNRVGINDVPFDNFSITNAVEEAVVSFWSHGGRDSRFNSRAAGGTLASPTHTLNSDILFRSGGGGYDGSGYTGNRALFLFRATEEWDDSSTGTKIDFRTTANGATATTTNFTVQEDGGIFAANLLGSATAGSDVRYQTGSGELTYFTSSARYKENIQNIGDTSWIYNLQPKTFTEKGGDVYMTGLIAEDVELIAPQMVFYKPNRIEHIFEEENKDGTIDRWIEYEYDYENQLVEGLDYEMLITPMLAELQKHEAEINALQGFSGVGALDPDTGECTGLEDLKIKIDKIEKDYVSRIELIFWILGAILITTIINKWRFKK
jgi:hypothetical protein